MPLNASGLKDDLEALASEPEPDIPGCAQQWAEAMGAYAASIVPASTAVAAATATLKTALESAFALPAAATSMETAFLAFATTVGGGMAPGFVATPPPAPIGFATQFAGPHPATHAEAAQAIADLVDAWMKTGTATPSGGGSPVAWS